MKVVVLGGYGNFGARICKALAGDSAIELVVAGRDARKAQALADELQAAAAVVDTARTDLAAHLEDLGAQLVIHTAGPFQAQGYGVARAAARAGCHYIDLADGRRFVCDFAAHVDGDFRGTGRSGITGASTVPALSSAVVDTLAARFERLDAIESCIAPAQKAPRGEATIAGVLSYCGAPVQVWRDGAWRTLAGWADPQPVRFARLQPRHGALCDIPDLELFPRRYAPVRDVMFRAALEVRATQYAFAALAWLRRAGVPLGARGLPRWLHQGGRIFDAFGTPDGGMVVQLRGAGIDGAPLQLAWHLTAPNHHGPEIPCMPAILLARKLARGFPLAPGAQPCMDLLTLEDFAPEFARWGMAAELQEERAS